MSAHLVTRLLSAGDLSLQQDDDGLDAPVLAADAAGRYEQPVDRQAGSQVQRSWHPGLPQAGGHHHATRHTSLQGPSLRHPEVHR